MMQRRSFMTAAALSAATMGAAATAATARATGKFKLRYGPRINAFLAHVGSDLIDNIKFAADQGFRGMFDNGLAGKPVDLQVKIANEIEKQEMKLGPFVMGGNDREHPMVLGGKEARDAIIAGTKAAVEVAKRVNCDRALLVPGNYDLRLHMDYQTANVIDTLRFAAEVAEPAGLVIVLEPLNWYANHPGLFLHEIPQAYMICRAVNSPSVKIVNDLYHQQISEGNLIPNIDRAWDEIGSFHVGDTPGRKEPGSGEINYVNVFKHIHSKGYDGVLCMEHGLSLGRGKEAEMGLIEAYRKADDF